MKKMWMVIVLLVLGAEAFCQHPKDKVDLTNLLKCQIVDGDTVPIVLLPEVRVFAKMTRAARQQRENYGRLVRNIKKTLPYARVAGQRLKDVNARLEGIKSESGRKAYLKSVEKDLLAEFEAPLRKLTFSQGKLLIKLIDRETGDTGYSLVKEYRGSVSAFFWQSLARVFGANLKDEYDMEGDDKLIEQIILQIDAGVI